MQSKFKTPDPFTLEGVNFEGPSTIQSVLATRDFQGNPSDIHLSTYPRSGTTWTSNILIGMVYGADFLQNDFVFAEVFPYLEFDLNGITGLKNAEKVTKSPRMFKSHLPLHLANREIFSMSKKSIILVRNPKDVALSFFEFYRKSFLLKRYLKSPDISDFLDSFLEGKVNYGSWWNWTCNWIQHCRFFFFSFLYTNQASKNKYTNRIFVKKGLARFLTKNWS